MAPSRRSSASINCTLCSRLAGFIDTQRQVEPTWHNAPVASFGDPGAELLIVGLAPGLSGANRTGRPFTGDYAGQVLYPALGRYGFTKGTFGARTDDGLELVGCRITNAVRCVPPKNKPVADEISTCRRYLVDELLKEPQPRIILTLGRIAHESVTAALELKRRDLLFGHGRIHTTNQGRHVVSSYHCSRYNINTGRLTTAMFDSVIASVRTLFDQG